MPIKTKHPLYKTWVKIKERCFSKQSDAYKNYGARGITMSNEWLDFNNFINDVGERPSGMTIDRIDVNGNYSKDNCRWATKQEQARGRRKTRWFDIGGVKMCLVDVAEKYNIHRKTLERRLKTGMSIENAISIPIGSINSNQYKKVI